MRTRTLLRYHCSLYQACSDSADSLLRAPRFSQQLPPAWEAILRSSGLTLEDIDDNLDEVLSILVPAGCYIGDDDDGR